MLPWLIAIYGVMSVVAFSAYGWDKRCAKLGRRRIPEKTLHGLAFFCGWPGAVVGQQLFRHKRRKFAFMLITLIIVVLHLAAWAFVVRYDA